MFLINELEKSLIFQPEDNLLQEIFLTTEKIFNITLSDLQKQATYILCQECFVEVPTGCGKTYVLLMAAIYLFLTKKKRINIITFNDYLSKRDTNIVRILTDKLELTVNYLETEQSTEEKINIIKTSHIVYTTIDNLCFLYMETDRKFIPNSIILIDEADSIILDKASTDMILTSSALQKDINYKIWLRFDLIKQLILEDNFENCIKLNYVEKTIYFKKKFIPLLREKFLYKFNMNLNICDIIVCKLGLLVHYFFHKGIEYDIEKGEVVYIDQQLGRIIKDIKFGNGIQEYLHKLHNLELPKPSILLDKVNIKNYLTKFSFVGGVSGTIYVNKNELLFSYNKLCVNLKQTLNLKKKVIFCANIQKKIDLITDIIIKNSPRPILIVTNSINESIFFYEKLSKNNFNINLLNAKNIYEEDEIISLAGKPNVITITTNLASRGIDIQLGGEQTSENNFFSNRFREISKDILTRLGGLLIITTQPAPNTRTQQQIYGRTARQKQPGEVISLTSAEDQIYDQLFDNENIEDFKTPNKIDILRKRVEYNEFQYRKNLYINNLYIDFLDNFLKYLTKLKYKNLIYVLNILYFLCTFKIKNLKTILNKQKKEFILKKHLNNIFFKVIENINEYVEKSIFLGFSENMSSWKKIKFIINIIITNIFEI